jgi:hypothetical protein
MTTRRPDLPGRNVGRKSEARLVPTVRVSCQARDGGSGAGDGTRTRDILLGKQTLYRLSYSRPMSSMLRKR